MLSQPPLIDRGARRVLSIDGGGLFSTFPASFLSAIEDKIGAPIGQHFDLIAGTSGGGIIALGLALGLPAQDILKLYVAKGPAIFGQGNGPVADFALQKLRALRQLGRPKYGSEALRDALGKVFGERRLSPLVARYLPAGTRAAGAADRAGGDAVC